MNPASLGCLLLVLGFSLPFLMFCGIAVVATLEESVGAFMAWVLVGLGLGGGRPGHQVRHREEAEGLAKGTASWV